MKFIKNGLVVIGLFVLVIAGYVVFELLTKTNPSENGLTSDYFTKEAQPSETFDAQILVATKQEQPLTSSEISIETNGLVIIKSDDQVSEVKVTYYQLADNHQVVFDLKISESTITQTNPNFSINNLHAYPITVHVPSDITDVELNARINAGSLRIENIDINRANIVVNAGQVQVIDSFLMNSDIDIQTGNLLVTQSQLSELEANINTGAIDINSLLHGKVNLHINTGNVKVIAPNLNAMNYQFEKSIGTIQLNGKEILEQSLDYSELHDTDSLLKVEVEFGDISVSP